MNTKNMSSMVKTIHNRFKHLQEEYWKMFDRNKELELFKLDILSKINDPRWLKIKLEKLERDGFHSEQSILKTQQPSASISTVSSHGSPVDFTSIKDHLDSGSSKVVGIFSKSIPSNGSILLSTGDGDQEITITEDQKFALISNRVTKNDRIALLDQEPFVEVLSQ